MPNIDCEIYFDQHPDPMWVYDTVSLRFLAVNRAAVEKYGYSEDEFLAITLKDIRSPDDVPVLLDVLKKGGSGVEAPGVFRHLTKSGQFILVDLTTHTMNYNGAVAKLVTAKDVTKLLQLERERDAVIEQLRITNKLAKVGAWRLRLPDRLMDWSEEAAAMLGVRGAQILSLEQALEFYAPEYRARMRSAFEACWETGAPFDEIIQLINAERNRVWARAIGEAERNAEGTIVAVRGASQDISELVAARERSEAASARLIETLNGMADGFATMDADWRFTFLNAAGERLLGRPRGSLLGRQIWAEFPALAGSTMQQHCQRAVSEKTAVNVIDYFAPMGRWFQITASPVADTLAVHFRDVTVERAKMEHLHLLEAAISRQNDVLVITEAQPIDAPDGPKIAYVNDAFVRLTGFGRGEAIGATPRILQGPDTDRRTLDRIRTSLERKQPVRAELVNYTKDGEPYWLEIDIVPIKDSGGNCTHFVAVERDITERKRVQESLRVSDERFKLVSKATTDVIWDWDLDGQAFWWSEGFQTSFGYGPEHLEPGPQSRIDRIHPDDRPRVVSGLEAAIASNDDHWRDEYRFLCADGGYLIVIDRGFIIRDATGRPVRVIGSLLDVTERRALDEQLRQSQKLEAIGQLTGGVAHDFNNLLTIILGNAGMLSEQIGTPTDEQQLRLLAEMTATAAERGAQLTNRLLAFARKQALEPHTVDLNRLVGGMDGLLRRTLGENIEIQVVRGGGLWAAEVDPNQLEAALLNLAINARDAMPDGGKLTFETANVGLDDAYASVNPDVKAGQYVMISVSDTGEGMTPDTLKRAFEPFFTTKDIGRGSGLGLSMVYGFLKQSGGHAKIYSELGEGTTVKLYLPRAAADADHLGAQTSRASIVGGSEHILIVEDDEQVRQHVINQLKGFGYRITDASSGPDALEILKQIADIDLLFTDVVMPGGMNGRQLAEAAQILRPNLKVLFTSGYTENAIVHHGRLDRGVHLLSKPYRRQDLAAKVRKVLDNPLSAIR